MSTIVSTGRIKLDRKNVLWVKAYETRSEVLVEDFLAIAEAFENNHHRCDDILENGGIPIIDASNSRVVTGSLTTARVLKENGYMVREISFARQLSPGIQLNLAL